MILNKLRYLVGGKTLKWILKWVLKWTHWGAINCDTHIYSFWSNRATGSLMDKTSAMYTQHCSDLSVLGSSSNFDNLLNVPLWDICPVKACGPKMFVFYSFLIIGVHLRVVYFLFASDIVKGYNAKREYQCSVFPLVHMYIWFLTTDKP